MNWYKQSMSLDPEAYKTEPQPARLQQHLDVVKSPWSGINIPQQQNQEEIDSLYSGVHFAFNAEHAALYACGKATKDDPPVVIEIDPIDLKQQPDVDAMLDQSLTYYLEEKRKVWQKILYDSNEETTPEDISNALFEDVDSDLQSWNTDGDVYDDSADVLMRNQNPIPPVVIQGMIEKKDPQQVIDIFNELISGKISNEMLIKMVGQMRVNNKIDSSRVKAIYQVPWLDFSADVNDTTSLYDATDEYLEEKGWHREGDDVKNEAGQIIPDYEELTYNQWLTLTPLYVNKQENFQGYSSENSVWHGTTLSRAKSAYPELLGGVVAKSNDWYKLAKKNLKKKDKEPHKNKSWYVPPVMRSMNYE